MKHLEPVVKKSSSYSILFLRDDSGVVRFRLKPFWIKFLGVLLFVFFGTSGAAGYAAHYYWKKYQALQLERSELAAKLGENRRQLGRFAGVEKIKESTLPRSTMAGVTSIAATPEGTNGGEAAQQNGDRQHAPPASPPTEAPPPAPPVAGQPPAAPPQDSGQPAAKPEAAGQSDPQAPPGDGSKPEDKEHPGFISEVQIKPAGNKTFRLSFDLSNRDSQLTLNGRVLVAVATTDGKRHEVTQVNRDQLRFIINRYKRVNTSFVLPDDLETDNVNRLFLTITAEDQPSVTYAFPVPSPS